MTALAAATSCTPTPVRSQTVSCGPLGAPWRLARADGAELDGAVSLLRRVLELAERDALFE